MDTQRKATPKDVFLHLLAIITLYVSAGSFISLLFQYINLWMPDPLNGYYQVSAAYGSIRFAIAALIIIFPAYVFTTRFLNKEYAANPEKRDMRIRKWLVYFTLFVAALIMLGDLVALVYTFLNGGLTTRFILQMLSVFVVVGIAFYYYYCDLKDTRPVSLDMFSYAAVVLGVAVIVAGFFVAGSPQTERLRKFDQQRVWDLQAMQGQLISYWQNKGMLPDNLDVLNNDLLGFRVPVDPDTGTAYEYARTGDLSFKLCALFALPSNVPAAEFYTGPTGIEGTWEHGEGRFCFDRTIDPDFFKLNPDREKPMPVPAR